MTTMHPRDLEKMLHKELQRLPAPRAPETLLPRVLAAVQAWARRPWYARAWLTWPLGLQIVSVAALLLLGVLGAMLLPTVQTAALDFTSGPAATLMGAASAALQRAELATRVIRVLWRALLQPVVAYVFALTVMMSLACTAFGALLNRVVLRSYFITGSGRLPPAQKSA